MVQNGILNIFNFIIAIIAGFLCERVGRRRLFLTSTFGQYSFNLLFVIRGIKIEPLFNFFRDVCLLDTSNSLFWPLFNNRKYQSCTHRDCYDMYVNSMSIIHNVINLLLCYYTKSFVLRFLWVHFGILFLLSSHSGINFTDDVCIVKYNLWTLIFWFHNYFLACIHASDCIVSFFFWQLRRIFGLYWLLFLVILSRFCHTHCVQRVLLSSILSFLCRWYSTSTWLHSFILVFHSDFPSS